MHCSWGLATIRQAAEPDEWVVFKAHALQSFAYEPEEAPPAAPLPAEEPPEVGGGRPPTRRSAVTAATQGGVHTSEFGEPDFASARMHAMAEAVGCIPVELRSVTQALEAVCSRGPV